VGAAGDHADRHTEIRIDVTSDHPQVQAAYESGRNELTGWTCTLLRSAEHERAYHVQIASQALNAAALSPGSRLRLAIRYEDDDRDGLPSTVLHWGRGLDGAWSSEGFMWVRLAN
jgi:hypothetical protein